MPTNDIVEPAVRNPEPARGPDPVQTETQPKQSTVKVVRAAIVGTVVEYYDFGIYGYMATIIASLFFVSENDTAALLGTFATFAVAFFLRVPVASSSATSATSTAARTPCPGRFC